MGTVPLDLMHLTQQHSQLYSNTSGNRQLLGQTNVDTVSDFFTVADGFRSDYWLVESDKFLLLLDTYYHL